MSTVTEPRLVNAQEVADRLGVCKRVVYRLADEGLPHYRIGAALRFDLDQVLDALQKEPA